MITAPMRPPAPSPSPHKRGLETENEVEEKKRREAGEEGGDRKRRRHACLTDR